MGLTSAMNTALNGLTLNETSIDVLGNNISNASTNGFKASQVLFTTQLARTLSIGASPNDQNAGTNPRQIGLGATTSAVQRDFTQGSITTSSSPSDLAVEGDGFFVVDGQDGVLYTRNGNFSLNSQSKLINAQGLRVQGYAVDPGFNLVTTTLQDIRIPLGDLNVAQETRNVSIKGALLSTGDVGTQGSELLSIVLNDTTTGTPATATSKLTDLRNAAGDTLFTAGQDVSFAPQKGGRTLDAQSLTVDASTTLQQLMDLMKNTIGIQSGGTIPDDPNTGGQPGVYLTGGQIQIVGNTGTANDVSVGNNDLTLVSNGNYIPLSFTKPQTANGESSTTNFIVYDSLGQPINVKMTMALEARNNTSTSFRYFIESTDDSDADISVGSGLVTFDSRGQVISGGTANFSLDRTATAAISPMVVTMDLSKISGVSNEQTGSNIGLAEQDGAPPGALNTYVIDETGKINGIFDNGQVRLLGQLVLARFTNPQGLLEAGSTAYREGITSGSPFLTTAGNFGAGTIRSGAIELSNTDIGRSLVDLIVASTNYRGNARVISSVNQLVDELLLLGR